jgi:hypothetical protein
MSKASSGVVCNILSNVKPAMPLVLVKFIPEQKYEWQKLTIIDNMINFPISSRHTSTLSYSNEDIIDQLDSSIHYFLGKVVGGNVSWDTNRVASRCLDFTNNLVESFLINTCLGKTSYQSEGVCACTHSLATTLAPSFANRRAVVFPIP